MLNLFQHLGGMYYIYILTDSHNSTLYIGVTNNIERRVYEHREGKIDGFSKKYNLHKLIYYEEYSSIEEAIRREKQLKNWHREWKLNLIKQLNPYMKEMLK